jgi:ABC-type phosphate/phosphonate transport system substrate-binding protein
MTLDLITRITAAAPSTRRHWLGTAGAGLLAALAPAVRGAEPLNFNIVPYLPARRLVAYYSALLPVLSSSLGRPVEIACAPNYRQHLDRLRTGGCDVVADSLFIARIAQRELGHVPVARTQAKLEPVLVTPAQGGLRNLEALDGQAVCVTDRIAALSILGLRYLRDRGLEPGQRLRVIVSGSHANSLHRMLAGDAAAAIVSRTTLKQVEPDLAQRVRVLQVLPTGLAAVVYHVSPRLAAQAPALSKALLEFANRTPEGRIFIDALGHQGLLPATPAELQSLDPMVVEFYRQLSVTD